MTITMGMMAQLLAETETYTGNQFMKELLWLIEIIISIAGALLVLYAVYIGYLFAMASDEGKVKAAKNRLMKVLSSALIIFALVSVIKVIDVSFNDVVVKNEEDTGTIDSSYDYEYVYDAKDLGTKPLILGTNRENQLTFYGSKIRIDGGKYLAAEEVKFTGFAIDEARTALTSSGTSSVKFGEKIMYYYFTCKNSNTDTTSIPCYKYKYLYYIVAMISFNHINVKDDITVRCLINVQLTNSKKPGYEFTVLSTPDYVQKMFEKYLGG